MKRWKVGKRDWHLWALGSTLIVLFLVQLLVVPSAVRAATTFDVTVAPVNVAPSFTKGTDQMVLEDCGLLTVSGWATSMSAGPADEAGQTLNFLVTNDNNALFSVQPAIAANGTLAFTPATNMNGMATVTVSLHDDGGTANGGVDTSAPQTFSIMVSEVNDTPTAVADAYPMLEDGTLTLKTAQLLSNDLKGPANESGQNLVFVSLGTTPANCTVSLYLGTITVHPTPDYNGPASFEYTIRDNGTTAGVPIARYATGMVNITVTAIADIVPDMVTTAEDTRVTIGVLANDTFEGTPHVTAVGAVSHGAVVINVADDIVTYAPDPDYNGGDSFTYTATSPAGVTETATVGMTINPVNDAPSFIKGADQTVDEDCGAQTVVGWGNTISAGPADEAGQAIDFIVTNDNTTLFSMQPAVAANGTLTFTPAAKGNGTASVTVSIHDNGGTVSDGVGTSAPQMFAITVTAVNDPPVDTYILTYTAGVGGSITGASPQTVNQGAGGTTVTATPNDGYHFVSWSDGVLTAARTDTNVTANINATATFAVNINTYAYTLTVTKVGNGTVTLVPAGETYNYGTVVTLTATPAAGYTFTGWSDDLAGRTNPTTIIMDAGKTITATYAPSVPRPAFGHSMVLTIGSKTMIVDGVRVALDAPAAIFEDRTFVPLRALVEQLGGAIDWNAKTRQVTIEVRGTTIVFTIGKATALVNGKSLAIDPKNSKVVPVISSGRSMLPLRFVAENLGFQVAWNAKAKTITLTWGD